MIVVGAGLVLAAVLAVPGAGAIAAPVHDTLYRVLGAGAWTAVLALIVVGIRLCASHEWRAGGVAAVGSAMAVLALLGLAGLLAPGSAGAAGRWVGPGLAQWLGRAGAGAVLVVGTVAGLVLAIDLRTARLVTVAAAALARARTAPASGKPSVRRRFPAAERTAELSGVPVPPFTPPDGGVPDAFFPESHPGLDLPPEPGVEEAEPEIDPSPLFPREFEGVPEPPSLGPVPEVTLSHAAELASDPEEKVWVLPTTALLDTIRVSENVSPPRFGSRVTRS